MKQIIKEQWPKLDFNEWKDTCETLHMWTQIVGKVKLTLCPFLNEWWNVGFQVTASGLSSGPIPYAQGIFQVDFNFLDHQLELLTSTGDKKTLPLEPRTVADFYHQFMSMLKSLGINVQIHTTPVETEPTIPFEEDNLHSSYDPEYVQRWWKIQVQCLKVFQKYKSDFFGKSSPIIFYWGSFDLATTRFSGRPAPLPQGPRFFQLAEDQENINCGFWPGNISASGLLYGGPAFYAYIYPAPEGIKQAKIKPEKAYYDEKFAEFILRYEDVRNSADPERTILEFLRSVYESSAQLAKWDRKVLEHSAAAEHIPMQDRTSEQPGKAGSAGAATSDSKNSKDIQDSYR